MSGHMILRYSKRDAFLKIHETLTDSVQKLGLVQRHDKHDLHQPDQQRGCCNQTTGCQQLGKQTLDCETVCRSMSRHADGSGPVPMQVPLVWC